MSPSEKVRALLDERGIEYTADDGEHVNETCWPYMGELTAVFAEYDNGTTRFACDTWCFTPEQAIAATVGVGTCKDLGGVGADDEVVFNCSECGCVLSVFDKDGGNNLCTSFIYDYPRFCPECGRRIIEEVTE